MFASGAWTITDNVLAPRFLTYIGRRHWKFRRRVHYEVRPRSSLLGYSATVAVPHRLLPAESARAVGNTQSIDRNTGFLDAISYLRLGVRAAAVSLIRKYEQGPLGIPGAPILSIANPMASSSDAGPMGSTFAVRRRLRRFPRGFGMIMLLCSELESGRWERNTH